MALILVITDAGRAALVNAKNDGTNAVRIASVGVSATAVTATPAATTLPGETKRIATISGGAVAKDVMHLVVRDETMDTYTLRSFALYLDNGVLFGLYGQATPIIEKSAQALMLLAIDVTLQDVAAGQITFGDANFLQPPATVDRPGVIELATPAEAAAGTDTVRAITPYTLRVTYGDVWRASNDGAGSGLDADLLDGQEGTWYADIPARLGFTPLNPRPIPGTIQYLQRGIFRFGSDRDTSAADVGNGLNVTTAETNGGATMTFHRVGFFGINMGLDSDNVFRWGGYSAPSNLMTLTMQGGLSLRGNAVWHTGNDGAGSGLDADLLDGQQGSWYADITARLGYTPIDPRPAAGTIQYLQRGIFRFGSDRDTSAADIGNGLNVTTAETNGGATMTFHRVGFFGVNMGLDSDNVFRWGGYSAPTNLMALTMQGGLSLRGNAVWHAGNDGAGSGMDADLLDGRDSNSFANASHSHNAADIAGAFGNASFGSSGYQVLPNGLILQWCTGATDATGTESTQFVGFPITFPRSCFVALVSTRISGASNVADAFYQTAGDAATNGVTVQRQYTGQAADNRTTTPFVIAIGN